MNTVLIVEDEKMIRQGLRVMIERSKVPVEMILECSNGEMALKALAEHEVDVMFTDIRMPKMDGIELVRRVQSLARRPLIVAVSGFDDFSYAVEMLRNGVKEYLLKPVEREKVVKILEQCEEELNARQQRDRMEVRLGQSQIRHLLTGEASEEELQLIEDRYGAQFFPNGYRICAASKQFYLDPEEETMVFVDTLPETNLCILAPESLDVHKKKELVWEGAGISEIYRSLKDLRIAYLEAFGRRKRAFYLGKMPAETEAVRIPEGLRAEAQKTIAESAWTQRLHLIGTDREEELDQSFKQLFFAAGKERITPEEFEQGMAGFLDGVEKIYRNVLTEEQKKTIQSCRTMYSYANLEEYQEELMALLYGIHSEIRSEGEVSGSQNKIRMAVDYVRQHYQEDLNMAVVSNYVSMNYSLFSYEWKQHTGKNFVDYLKEIRIEQARTLLETSDYKVIEISQMVGYENEKHFMKTFKKVCGISPSEYRKMVKQQ